MHPKKTVIVVGAGASQEVNLPTSTALKTSIANILDIRFHITEQISGDFVIADALKMYFRDINPHLHACWKMRDALPQAMSIDNFIDSHRGNEKIELCGKLAIVRSILEAERKSYLFFDRYNSHNTLNFKSLEETWFNVFWQRISENCQAEGLQERFSAITLIIFNYDRCIEHFLYHSIQNYYGLSADAAASLINGMDIFHPYGVVGSLPWTDEPAQMDFGAEPCAQDLVELAKQIKTFTEGTNPEASNIMEIRDQVAKAETLVFLGFAYHKQNLELLKRPTHRRRDGKVVSQCYGTALGMSDADIHAIAFDLQEVCGGFIRPDLGNNLTCLKLFNTYRRALSFV